MAAKKNISRNKKLYDDAKNGKNMMNYLFFCGINVIILDVIII
jgi:hypothetical protein